MPNQTSDNTPAGPVVVLVDPTGREYASSSPIEISNLHYTQGYSFKDDLTFSSAVASLGAELEETPAEEAPAEETPESAPQPVSAPTPTPDTKSAPPKDLHD